MTHQPTPLDITKAAIETAFDTFKATGVNQKGSDFLELLREAIDEYQSTVPITLTSPNGDAGSVKDLIADVVQAKLKKPVSIQEKADPGIIGGIIIQFKDERIDMSVKKALLDARETL
ncbi:MAG: hypothetical protein JWM56_362 [Candidatus Peribacteria bacterium]|nr:hypothetical protein [Candidatus Peribacteria bacterium]